MDISPAVPISNAFDIISTIRYDPLLIHSEENTRVNATINSTLAKVPSPYYMLSYHRDRMLASAKAFGWNTSPLEGPEGFEKLLGSLQEHLQTEHTNRDFTPIMLRIAFSVDGQITITSNGPCLEPATITRFYNQSSIKPSSALYPKHLSTVAEKGPVKWRVFLMFERVTPSLYTRHKTSNRQQYERALGLFPHNGADLVVNGIKLQTEILIINDFNDRWEIMEGCRFTPYFWRGDQWLTPATQCGGNLGTTRRWALDKGLCKEGVLHGPNVRHNEIIVLSNGARGFQTGIVQDWNALLPDDTDQDNGLHT